MFGERARLAEVTTKALPEGTVTVKVPVPTTTLVASEPDVIVKLISGLDKSMVWSAL